MAEVTTITENDDEAIEDLLHGKLKIIQKKKGYRFSIDAVLLANFAKTKKGESIVDLGTGCGVIPLIISWRNLAVELTGIERNEDVADMAKRSVGLNSLEDRISIVHGDLRNIRTEFKPESFSAAVANPPYGVEGSGRLNPSEEVASARHELEGGLDDFLSAASYLVKFGGRVSLIFPARRLADIVAGLRAKGFEPKRLQMVHSREGENAKLQLIEGIKGGGIEMEVLKPLYIYKSDRSYSDEVEGMYR